MSGLLHAGNRLQVCEEATLEFARLVGPLETPFPGRCPHRRSRSRRMERSASWVDFNAFRADPMDLKNEAYGLRPFHEVKQCT